MQSVTEMNRPAATPGSARPAPMGRALGTHPSGRSLPSTLKTEV